MALNTVTLTWDLEDFLQVNIPEQCVLYIVPSSLLTDVTDSRIIPAIPRTVTFTGGSGSLAGIVANDNSVLAPTGSTYQIWVFDPSANRNLIEPFNAAINRSNGATQDLSYLYNNQSFSGPSFFQYLAAQNNLSELTNPATARTNLGLGPLATAAISTVQASLAPQFLSAGTVYNASVNDLALTDCTTGITAVNLPSAPANGSTISVKMIKQNTPSGSTGLYYTTISTQGIDKFETSTGGTTATITLIGESATWQYNSANHVWIRQWGVLPWSKVQANMTSVLNVASFGADPTGVNDSTTAIQAAINAATGSAAPASNSRTCIYPVYLPPGTFKVTSDLNIRSVIGFRFTGAGADQTTITASGTGFTQAVLFVDGSLDGLFEGFTINGDGTEAAGASTLPNGIRLDWTTAAARSTSANRFRDIRTRTLKATIHMSLEGNGSRQVDGSLLDNVVLSGSQVAGSWSNTGPYQVGFAFGNGTYANNYNHVMVTCGASGFYTGWKCSASSFALYGAQPAANAQDFSIQPGAQCTISNVQSQDCGTFLVTPAAFAPTSVSFTDIEVTTTHPALAGNLMISLNGGIWNFSNFTMPNITASGVFAQGTIAIAGTASTRPVTATFDNLTTFGSRTAAFSSLTNTNLIVRNYINYNPNTGLYTAPASGDILSTYNGSWVSIPATSIVQFFTSSGTYTMPAGAQTVYVAALAGGGGGGSGAFAASGASGGGGGGGSGGYSAATFQASQITSPVTVTVGTGGNGGAAVTSASAGNPGAGGVQSQFGNYLWAHGGLAGAAGNATNAAGAAGGAGGSGLVAGASGGTSVTTGAVGGAGFGGVSGGGGAGGGVIAGPTAEGGGGAVAVLLGSISNASSGGVVGGASPTNGSAVIQGNGAPGGGGGAAATTGAAQQGANGQANTGAGGGGGGACTAGTTSGAGGNGGSGFVLVITYFQ